MYLSLHRKDLEKLRHLQWDDTHSTVAGNYPDFFIAGPQRTGTTWLATQIRRHPQIQMAWPKELYFFNRLAETASGKSYHYYASRKKVSKEPREALKDFAKIAYFDHFGRGGFNSNQLQWYLSFFSNSIANRLVDFSTRDFRVRRATSKLIRGEATASYATLDESIIDDMILLNPAMKIILTLRNPIDRAWSHARKDLPEDTRKAKEQGFVTQELREFFQNDYQIRCSCYAKIIEKWEKKLNYDSLLVINYHEIDNNPKSVLMKFWEFLAVDADWMPKEELVQSKINARRGSAVPQVVYDLLADILQSQLLWFNEWSAGRLAEVDI